MSAAKHSSFGEAVARATRLGVSQLTSSCVSTKFFEEPNFSAFSQFFMVYNSAYNSYREYSEAKKKHFIYEMLRRYCKERHSMYSSHGYTNAILQVMCDNYSHKRNSKTTIDKIIDVIEPMGFTHLSAWNLCYSDQNFYFLPDKGDTDMYLQMVSELSLENRALSQAQDKLPDFVLKCNGEYYIGEAKMMKGSGGGQDKQLVEIINFIRYQEKNKGCIISFILMVSMQICCCVQSDVLQK